MLYFKILYNMHKYVYYRYSVKYISTIYADTLFKNNFVGEKMEHLEHCIKCKYIFFLFYVNMFIIIIHLEKCLKYT